MDLVMKNEKNQLTLALESASNTTQKDENRSSGNVKKSTNIVEFEASSRKTTTSNKPLTNAPQIDSYLWS